MLHDLASGPDSLAESSAQGAQVKVSDEEPPTRPAFRKLAGGVAVVCFILTAIFGIARPEDGLFAPGICLFVGAVMAVIAVTGHWPPRR